MRNRPLPILAAACALLANAAAANATPTHLVPTKVVDASVSKSQHQLALDFQTGSFRYNSTAELSAIERANEPGQIAVVLPDGARLTKIAYQNGAFPEGDYVFYYKLTSAQESSLSNAVRAHVPLTITYMHGGTLTTEKMVPSLSKA